VDQVKRLLASLLLMLAVSANAMTIDRKDDGTLQLQGRITPEDVGTVIMYASLGVTRVVISDSAGGNMQAAMRVAEVLRSNKVTTVVDGLCVSACALIFLGGEQRVITSTGAVGLHSSTLDGLRSERGNQEMARFIAWRTNDKFPSGLLSQAFRLTGNSSMLLIMAGSIHLLDNGKMTDLPAYRSAWHVGMTTQQPLTVGKAR
jgi:hypothetical protein